ncbi:hypothetical protein Xen7305DRAFT_00021550 [Xenococcus sp. PCC 7305]|nr:hypothetical protein [Xenococcus sp. PCC 7305]ELS02441.1 hypothetical protein Xen7305DRAFT_00021550 [Xenococcus sp. PCC 7305]
MMLGFVPLPNLQICDRATDIQDLVEDTIFSGTPVIDLEVDEDDTEGEDFIEEPNSDLGSFLLATHKNQDLSIKKFGSNYHIPVSASGVSKFRSRQVSVAQISPEKIGILQISPLHSTTIQIGTSQVGSTQVRPQQERAHQISLTQVASTQIGLRQVDFRQINSTQINFTQINSREISFSRSISSEQFFSIHNSTPQTINDLNNSATNVWSDLLQPETQLDINFQITDLPSGQLAEATIAGFDPSGKPNAGKILIDRDANGVGWFIDETPFDNSEFINQNSGSYFLADPESEAHGKYDLLITVSGLKPQRKQ